MGGERKNVWCLQAVHGSVREISSCLCFFSFIHWGKSAAKMVTCSDTSVTTFWTTLNVIITKEYSYKVEMTELVKNIFYNLVKTGNQ